MERKEAVFRTPPHDMSSCSEHDLLMDALMGKIIAVLTLEPPSC